LGRALGLALGYAADQLLGDPTRYHPVAGFGKLAAHFEPTLPSTRARGAAHAALLVGGSAVLGRMLDRGTLPTAAAAYVVLGGRSLSREAAAVAAHLERGDLAAAREQVTHLVGRDPSTLDEDGIARATVESVAENTSDAVVAPLFWGALAGPAGLFAYRAANTLDAMIGHRTPRHTEFGWAAARLDDLANLAPARLTAGLAVLLGSNPSGAWRAWREDAYQHPSPNAGPVEAAFAGSLGIRLGGSNTYDGHVEDRGFLGSGPAPTRKDIARANRFAEKVGLGALAVSVLLASRRRRRRS